MIEHERDRAEKAARHSQLEKKLLTEHPNVLSGLNAGVAVAVDVAARLEQLQRLRDHRFKLTASTKASGQ